MLHQSIMHKSYFKSWVASRLTKFKSSTVRILIWKQATCFYKNYKVLATSYIQATKAAIQFTWSYNKSKWLNRLIVFIIRKTAIKLTGYLMSFYSNIMSNLQNLEVKKNIQSTSHLIIYSEKCNVTFPEFPWVTLDGFSLKWHLVVSYLLCKLGIFVPSYLITLMFIALF